MKNWSIVVILAGLSFVFASCQQLKENFKNFTFENKLNYWQTELTDSGKAVVDDADYIQGKYSLKISNDSKIEEQNVKQTITLLPETDYTLTAWVKTAEDKTLQGARITLQNATSGRILLESELLKTNEIWRQIFLNFHSGTATRVNIILSSGKGAGAVWFDDLAIEPGTIKVIQQDTESVASMENIALGKTVSFNVNPNYSLCTDKDDRMQLTDGVYTKGYFWTQKSTVGWHGKTVTITIDLGMVEPISGISVNTAARKTAGVLFPSVIGVLVSDDDKEYHFIGDLVEMDSAKLGQTDKFQIHKFSTAYLSAHGRYVKIVVVPSGTYVFCDEIEIFKGPANLLSVKLPGKLIAPNNIINACVGPRLLRNRIRARMRQDLNTVEKFLSKNKERYSKTFSSIRKQVDTYKFNDDPKSFRAIMPLNPLHTKIFALFGDFLRESGVGPFTVWGNERYDSLPMFAIPAKSNSNLNIRLMRGEYRSGVLNVTNAGKTPLTLKVSVKGLPPGILTVRETEFTGTREGSVVATALPLMLKNKGGYTTSIPIGFTRQIWFGVHAVNISPGVYNAVVKLDAGEYHSQLPLKLTVSSLRFPDSPRLNTILWDYTSSLNYALTKKNVGACVSDMKQHYVNVTVGGKRCAGMIKPSDFDKQGNLKRKLNFDKFDSWLKRFPNARHYQVFMLCHPQTQFAGFKRGTSAFSHAISDWAKAWTEHVRAKGLRKGQVQVHFLDEPHSALQFKALLEWAKPFSEATDFIDIFNDPTVKVNPEKMPHMKEALSYVDVLCPLLQHVRGNPKLLDYYQKWRKKGKTMWLYMCSGPNRHFDPSYFRLQPWECFRYGAVGSGFWAYADTGKMSNSWNPYVAMSGANYSPVFLTPTETTTSKHWEAFREGVEDYEYLRMLQERLRASNSSNDPKWKKAKTLLDSISATIMKKTSSETENIYWAKWRRSSPCVFAEKGRLTVLEALESLKLKQK